jgi:hypothetical protein
MFAVPSCGLFGMVDAPFSISTRERNSVIWICRRVVSEFLVKKVEFVVLFRDDCSFTEMDGTAPEEESHS